MADTPRYSYLGPAGTFTWEALTQVPDAEKGEWVSVNNVGEALDDVQQGRSDYAMIAIENSIEGGVSATQDALAVAPELRMVGEYMVPVRFVLATAPGTAMSGVTTVAAHAVAYAQCRTWLETTLPQHHHVPAASNVQAALSVVDGGLAGCGNCTPRDYRTGCRRDSLRRTSGTTPMPLPVLSWCKKAAKLPPEQGQTKPASSPSSRTTVPVGCWKCWSSLPPVG
jgi:prephenate dehydratase